MRNNTQLMQYKNLYKTILEMTGHRATTNELVEIAGTYKKDVLTQLTRGINQKSILTIVSDFYNVPINKIKSQSQQHTHTLARQMVIYFNYKYFNQKRVKNAYLSRKDIAAMVNRQRPIVNHTIKTVNNLKAVDKKFNANFQELENKIIQYLNSNLLITPKN